MKEAQNTNHDLMRISSLIKALENDFHNPEKQWCFLYFLEKTINESADGYILDCQEIFYDKKDGHFHSRLIHTNGGNMFDSHTWGYSLLSSLQLWNMMNDEKARLRSVYCYEDDAAFDADYMELMRMLINWERTK